MLRIVFGLALAAHGLGHIMGFLAAWTRLPMGFAEAPWLFSRRVVITSGIGRAWGVLWLLVMAATIASAAGVVAHAAWWRPVAVASAIASLAVILPWWRAAGPARSAVLFDIIVLLALTPAWGARIAEAVR